MTPNDLYEESQRTTGGPVVSDDRESLALLEQGILRAMFNGGADAAIRAAGHHRLTADHFAHPPGNGALFDVLCDLSVNGGRPMEPQPVLEELRRRAKAEGAAEAYGFTPVDVIRLWEHPELAPPWVNLDYYAQKVAEAGRDRAAKELLATAAGRIAEPGADGVAAADWFVTEYAKIAAGAPTGTTLTTAEEEAFWRSRPELDFIRTAARARMASPWATFGVVLVRILSQVPPEYVLPPVIGTHASLNLFVAVVAESGEGKGAAMGAAADAYKLGEVNTWPVGTGEGVVKSFVHFTRDEATGAAGIEQHETSVVFDVREVDELGAIRGRQGSTILSKLRSGWMGEEIGNANSDLDRRLKVDEHAYRLGLVVGVQPGRGEILLNDGEVAGGTPQRLLWLPGTDPGIPDVTPSHPGQATWQMPPWPQNVRFTPGRHVIHVWPGAIDVIKDARRQRLRGQGGALDGHALLCREKVAAALGLLNGHVQVTEEDWQLSGVAMAVSDRTRASVADALAVSAAAKNRRKGEEEAERRAIVTDRAEAATIQRACKAVLARLGNGPAGEWVSHSDLRHSLRANHRPYFEEAVALLAETGQVAAKEIEYNGEPGRAYRRS